MNAPGLYIHLPFCRRRCSYCDFAIVVGGASRQPAYGEALRRELRRAGPELRAPVGSVFIGGGTPSFFPLESLRALLDDVRRLARPIPDAEWTTEANPETATAAWLHAARGMGLNRLSLGAQSFHEPVLSALTRTHTPADARRAVGDARAAGFDSVSIDLMYGCPQQTPAVWADDLEQTLELEPDHLSLYALTLEERTRLARETAAGRCIIPDEDEVAGMYELACARLEDLGWEHYEISNWARPGHRCRHNLTYWRRGEYVGLGLGAHSHLDGARFHNPRAIRRYLEAYADESGPRAREDEENLIPAQQLAEALFLGLRTDEGIDPDNLRETFGETTMQPFQTQLDQLLRHGLLRRQGTRLTLAPAARLISDSIFARFVTNYS